MGMLFVLRLVAVGLLGCALCLSSLAAVNFPAIDRPAIKDRSPERTFLLAVAQAGSRLVAVGERGVVVLSDDAGAHWRQAREVPVSVTLTALCFVNAVHGWAVGHGGVVLRTDDGGETWLRQTEGGALARIELESVKARETRSPGDPGIEQNRKMAERLVADGPDKPLLDVIFTDEEHGFVVGAEGLFFETTNGGKSWTSAMHRIENPQRRHLYAIRAQHGAVFVAGEQGLLLRSQDGGERFQSLPSPYSGSWFCLAVLPSGALVAAGLRGHAFYSADRGTTWSRIWVPRRPPSSVSRCCPAVLCCWPTSLVS
jgi:photosystem II stability/assembly factor-like uncharacterized protein